jgi:hypothetical protein
MSLLKVLGISKRRAELCANQALLHAAGLQLLTTDNLEAAYKLAESKAVGGAIICRDSWPDAEREAVVKALKGAQVPVMNCPGCVGCDEVSGKAGWLDVVIPLSGLIERVQLSAEKSSR